MSEHVLEVVEEQVVIEVLEQRVTVEVTESGPQGPQGPPGVGAPLVLGPDEDVPPDTPPNTVIVRRTT